MTSFLSNREIYTSVVCGIVPQVRERLWIATADIKDLYVEPPVQNATAAKCGGHDMVPFLEVLAGMVKRGIEVRLIHAKEPGPNWREDFDRYPGLWEGMERMLCPRVHFKCIIVDGAKAYFGSANLTGAGMGAKSEKKRNFENGILTDDPALVAPVIEQFDKLLGFVLGVVSGLIITALRCEPSRRRMAISRMRKVLCAIVRFT